MKISQTKEARAIRALLRNKKLDQQKVWAILTALSGPDNESASIQFKGATTGLIRGSLGINCTDILGYYITSEAHDNKNLLTLRKKFEMGEPRLSHFLDHALCGFQALNLKWNEVNE